MKENMSGCFFLNTVYMTIVAIQNISNRASCQKTLRSTMLTTQRTAKK